MQSNEFLELLWNQGRVLYRNMPWRDDTRPYYVLVSELMLQQTQVARVLPKFEAFIERFPNERSLAAASLADVLTMWQGLGYNRRAKYLHNAVRMVVNEFSGVFPERETDIRHLPGVGPNTAGAILAYAFNQPSIFIETNIRTVIIHHFFKDNFDITDKEIRGVLSDVLDREHPREFYWALMDYGSWLKQNGIKNILQSRHYKKQSALEGSIRQVRGAIVRELSAQTNLTLEELRLVVKADERFEPALNGLVGEGIVSQSDGRLHLTK